MKGQKFMKLSSELFLIVAERLNNTVYYGYTDRSEQRMHFQTLQRKNGIVPFMIETTELKLKSYMVNTVSIIIMTAKPRTSFTAE